MSRHVIIKTNNENILNDARKEKFIADYAQMIQSKVKSIDNHQHDTTSNKRHMKRVTDRVVEDLLENLPEVGYVTKKTTTAISD
jgi:hypothetical protein